MVFQKKEFELLFIFYQYSTVLLLEKQFLYLKQNFYDLETVISNAKVCNVQCDLRSTYNIMLFKRAFIENPISAEFHQLTH